MFFLTEEQALITDRLHDDRIKPGDWVTPITEPANPCIVCGSSGTLNEIAGKAICMRHQNSPDWLAVIDG